MKNTLFRQCLDNVPKDISKEIDKKFDIMENATCRTCKHRQRYQLNSYSTKIIQCCDIQPSKRSNSGYETIKVTDKACFSYEDAHNNQSIIHDLIGITYALMRKALKMPLNTHLKIWFDMIPTIKKETHFAGGHPIYSYECWTVRGKYGCDECLTFGQAIRYWLWHCGVPARMAFWGIHPPRRPEYYKLVTIEYIDHIMGELVTTNAWLAVDDDDHYIWTLDDNITVIDDDDVLDWRYM